MLQIYENNLMFDSQSLHMHLMDGGCFQVVPTTGPQPDDPYRRYAIVGDTEAGDFYIEAKNNVYIEIRYKDGLDSGTITINTTGTVNIGADASAVNIAGGGKKLSHGTHTHTTPVAIPGPPQTSTPTSDNTTKTEAD